MSKRYILQNPQEEDVKIIQKVLENDMFTKYEIEAKVSGEMICSTDKKSYVVEPKNALKKETYQEYLDSIVKIPKKNYQWIYNIVDGKSEQEYIIYSDEKFLLIPTDTWDRKTMLNTHVLAIVKDKKLRCLRSLTGDHVGLLEHIINKSLEQLELNYNIPKEKFRMYIHYYPSTWHLHMHFNLVENKEHSIYIDSAYELRNVIQNLKLCSNYYQMIDFYVESFN